MKKQVMIPILLVAFALLMTGAYVLYDRLGQENRPDQLLVETGVPTKPNTDPTTQPTATSPTQPDASKPPQSLPLAADFTAYDLDGNPVKLSDYFGKPIVLNFWASWCGPCQMEMPDFNEKYLEFKDEVQFLMVNMTGGKETLESASAFIQEKGYQFPVFYDTHQDAASTYQVMSLPTTYFIDATGHRVARATGAIDGETLQYGIDILLGKAELK